MSTATENQIAQARLVKAVKLVKYIRHEAILRAIVACVELSDEDWLNVAEKSGVQTKTAPSAESKELVIMLLRSEL